MDLKKPRSCRRVVSRRAFLTGLTATGAALSASRVLPGLAPAVIAKPLAGQTVKVLLWSHTYTDALRDFLPEFTDLTGAKVEMDLSGFQVANQRVELELAGGTGVYDVTVNTFIWSGKWIGAGWCTDLLPLVNDPQLTDKPKFALPDFVDGVIKTFQRGEKLYGIPWSGESTLLMYRKDIFEKYGIGAPPETFDDMLGIAQKIHTRGVAANLTRGTNGLNWAWPTFLFAYGGRFFANPPADMTPLLNSAEAVKSAEIFGTLTGEFGVPGSLSFGHGDTATSFSQGKAAMWIDALGLLSGALDPKRSLVHDKVSFALPPRGPAGRTPQIAPHALMIPAATRDKRRGWEFIKWATSRDMQLRIALEKNNAPISRKSVLSDPNYRSKFNWGGADLGALQAEVFRLAGSGYMVYRSIPEFGPIADRVTIALAEAITKQRPTKAALDALNRDVVGILKKAGYKNLGRLPTPDSRA